MSTVRRVSANGNIPAYWYVDMPNMQDLEDLIFEAGNRKRYLLVVVGTPFEISPEWWALHPMREKNTDYNYAVSYSIPARTLGYLLDNAENVEEMFNLYLEDVDPSKGWESIDRIELVDRQNWKNRKG